MTQRICRALYAAAQERAEEQAAKIPSLEQELATLNERIADLNSQKDALNGPK